MLKSASLTTLAVALITSAGLYTPAMAQSGASSACPQSYERLTGELCFKAANGDIVLAEPRAATVTYTNADCRRGYQLMIDNLCIHPQSGDVVFVTDRPAFAAATCRAGYEFLVNGLCFNRQSGDIVFSEVKTGITVTAATR